MATPHITSNEGHVVTVTEDRGEIVLAINGVEATVPVEDFARLLVDESESFVKGLSELVQRAIIQSLDAAEE